MVQIDIFYEAEQKWLDHARHAAVNLLRQRKGRGINIEDVLYACPRPNGVSRNANSRVFRNDVFRHIGYTRAQRTAARSHVLRAWCLNDAYFEEDE